MFSIFDVSLLTRPQAGVHKPAISWRNRNTYTNDPLFTDSEQHTQNPPLPLSIFKAPSILPLWRKNSVAIVTSWQRDTRFSFPISPFRVMNSMCSLNITLTSFFPCAHARQSTHSSQSKVHCCTERFHKQDTLPPYSNLVSCGTWRSERLQFSPGWFLSCHWTRLADILTETDMTIHLKHKGSRNFQTIKNPVRISFR